MKYNTEGKDETSLAEKHFMEERPAPNNEVEIKGVPMEYAIAVPPIPDAGRHLWEAFTALSRYRVERNPIMPNVISDWLNLHGQTLSSLEISIIEAMDRTFTKEVADLIKANQT